MFPSSVVMLDWKSALKTASSLESPNTLRWQTWEHGRPGRIGSQRRTFTRKRAGRPRSQADSFDDEAPRLLTFVRSGVKLMLPVVELLDAKMNRPLATKAASLEGHTKTASLREAS